MSVKCLRWNNEHLWSEAAEGSLDDIQHVNGQSIHYQYSIPNAQHWSTMRMRWLWHWPYKYTGISETEVELINFDQEGILSIPTKFTPTKCFLGAGALKKTCRLFMYGVHYSGLSLESWYVSLGFFLNKKLSRLPTWKSFNWAATLQFSKVIFTARPKI